MKPYEVEIVVGEVDGGAGTSGIYHILFDGSVSDEQGFVAIGGHAEELTDTLRDRSRRAGISRRRSGPRCRR
jgi:proteasome alpha subunit